MNKFVRVSSGEKAVFLRRKKIKEISRIVSKKTSRPFKENSIKKRHFKNTNC